MIDDMLEAFNTYPMIYYVVVGIYSLMVGSFLNVVIYRLPKMLKQGWTQECLLYLADEAQVQVIEQGIATEPKLTLSKPDSTCPSCQHKIRFYENIPILSWLLLGGKCSKCRLPISMRYPLIEGLTAGLSVIVAAYYGVTWSAFFALFLTWSLLCLFFIDYEHMLLPDVIVIPLLWLGLIANIFGAFVTIEEAVIGAMSGYGSLYCLMGLYKLVTGREGMGHGDYKLIAMFGAWFGWLMLPPFIFIAALGLTVVGLGLKLCRGNSIKNPVPFGPYLIVSGFVCLLWGEVIWSWYP